MCNENLITSNTLWSVFIGITRELWPRSKTESLVMTSKLGIPVSVTSNPEAGKLALNMDIQAYNGRA